MSSRLSKRRPRQGLHATITSDFLVSLHRNQVFPWMSKPDCLKRPRSAFSGHAFLGVNTIALWSAAERWGFRSSCWAKVDQWKQLGYRARVGEKSARAVKYCKIPATAGALFAKSIALLNADQVEWYCTSPRAVKLTAARVPSAVREPNDLMDLLVRFGPASDLRGRFGQAAPALEKLTLEFGRAFLCADFGWVIGKPMHRLGWLDVLQVDDKAISVVAAHAERAIRQVKSHLRDIPKGPPGTPWRLLSG